MGYFHFKNIFVAYKDAFNPFLVFIRAELLIPVMLITLVVLFISNFVACCPKHICNKIIIALHADQLIMMDASL